MSDFVFTLPAWEVFSSYDEETQKQILKGISSEQRSDESPIYEWRTIGISSKIEVEEEDKVRYLLRVLDVEEVVRWSFNAESSLVYRGEIIRCPYDFERASAWFEFAQNGLNPECTDEEDEEREFDTSYGEAYYKVFDELWKPTLEDLVSRATLKEELSTKIESLTNEVKDLKDCILALENQPPVQVLCECGRNMEVHISESTKELAKHFRSLCN